IAVTYGSSKVTIKNDQFVKVTFGQGRLCVEIPDVPMLQGEDVLCGLAGNRDSNCKDDFRNRYGFVYTNVTRCSNRNKLFTEVFGDTWITKDFLPLQTDTACLTGEEVFNDTLNCDLLTVKEECGHILDAALGKGPFAACKDLGNDTIENAYENCVFDVCSSSEQFCKSMTTFAKICQITLPNTPLEWRGPLNCPELHCPLHSKPSPCATGCPNTCTDPDYSESCLEGCAEGCECEAGYVLDTNDPTDAKCILLEQCGCVDPNGNPHRRCAEGCECEAGYVLDTNDPTDAKCILLEQCGCIDPNGNPHRRAMCLWEECITDQQIFSSRSTRQEEVQVEGCRYTTEIHLGVKVTDISEYFVGLE
uniref:C8 domain-containing protein n=1 Tax=Ascaris lumbricoides TaxID=6252 RepID=A0A0M3IPX1_ASCLU